MRYFVNSTQKTTVKVETRTSARYNGDIKNRTTVRKSESEETICRRRQRKQSNLLSANCARWTAGNCIAFCSLSYISQNNFGRSVIDRPLFFAFPGLGFLQFPLAAAIVRALTVPEPQSIALENPPHRKECRP